MTLTVIQRLNEYQKVLIIGPFPPPLGGVSVHIYRLSRHLTDPGIFDTSAAKGIGVLKYFGLCYGLLSGRYRVVHVHYMNHYLLAILYTLKLIKKFKIVATVHNPRLFQGAGFAKKEIACRFLKKVDVLVAVSDEIVQDLKARSIDLPGEIIVEPAYLPPPADDEESITATYPESLLGFISSHHPIVSANAYALTFDRGTDLYGLETCIDLTDRLRSEFPDIGFLFALAEDQQNKGYLDKMRNKIADLNLGEAFHLMTGQKELWPLFKKIDLMVRPTSSDGDAVSIREALQLGTPAVASDVVGRPAGTTLYRYGDPDDLYRKARDILRSGSATTAETRT